MRKLLDAFPERAAIVPDVRFRLTVRGEKVKTGRDLVVISTHGLSAAETEHLRALYLEEIGRGHVSFPLKERAKHLKVRIDERLLNFGRAVVNWLPQFRVRRFRVPGSRSLEVVIRLTSTEDANLQAYLANILRNRKRTLGGFSMEGHQFTAGKLDHNVALHGRHNCSSWIATAPIGAKGEALLELLGGDRALEVGTNPGWWTNWLAAAAPPERIPFVIHWTPKPLHDALREDALPERNLPWDFNRH